MSDHMRVSLGLTPPVATNLAFPDADLLSSEPTDDGGSTPNPPSQLAPKTSGASLAVAALAGATLLTPATAQAAEMDLLTQGMASGANWYIPASLAVAGWGLWSLRKQQPAGLLTRAPRATVKEQIDLGSIILGTMAPLALGGGALALLTEDAMPYMVGLMGASLLSFPQVGYLCVRSLGYRLKMPSLVPAPPRSLKAVAKKMGAAVVAVNLAYASETAVAYGDHLSAQVTQNSRQKLAVEVVVQDEVAGEIKPVTIGYIYGGRVGAAEDIMGDDQAIEVHAEAMSPDGPLHIWYEALKLLEDRSHEGGFSDDTGINPRLFWALATLGKNGGGSSIADQTCGAMRSGFAETQSQSRLQRKLDETLCGVGLARTMLPQEIAALYATFAFMGMGNTQGVDAFARKFWGLEGIDDPKLTVGHQLVLAAMINRPWTGENWLKIRGRAEHALGELIAAGVISMSQRESTLQEIKAARPFANASKIKPISPVAGYDYPLMLAAREAEARFGPDWREEVRSLTLTIDPNVQGRLRKMGVKTLAGIEDRAARYSGLVIDERGHVLAADTGKVVNGKLTYDGMDRLHEKKSAGSLGKVLLAVAAGNVTNARAVDLQIFQDDLRWSRPRIVETARNLPVSTYFLRQLIGDYGDTPEHMTDPITVAATGAFDITMMEYISVLRDVAWKRRNYALPYVVGAYTLNDGHSIRAVPAPRIAPTEPGGFSTFNYSVSGALQTDLLSAPLTGTLSEMVARVPEREQYDIFIGKTGTVGREDAVDNNSDWMLAALGHRQGHDLVTVMVNVGADLRNHPVHGLGPAGAELAFPVAGIINSVDDRWYVIERATEGESMRAPR